MSKLVCLTYAAAIRTIRMNRPEKKNALTQPMYAEMTRALREAGTNDAIRCIVLAGGQGAFCAGADIGEFLESAQSGGLRPMTLEFLKALAHNPKPLVAAVGGLAVGIGTTMLFHCDHVVAMKQHGGADADGEAADRGDQRLWVVRQDFEKFQSHWP